MATDRPTPATYSPEILRDGEHVLTADARSNAMERWVLAVAAAADAQLDWYYSGGRAQLLHLGDMESRIRVEAVITELQDSLDGHIMERIPIGA